jgi:N6-adenosine-specific RNA methylase IME4
MSSAKISRRRDTLFDVRPIALDGFTLHARGVEAHGKPTAKQWVAVAQYAAATEAASPYWIGSLMAYAESRDDWREKLDQMVSLTGLSEKTIRNHTAVVRSVEPPELELAPTFSHAAAVAGLTRPQQTRVLTNAKLEGWTVSQTARAVRHIKRPLVLEGQAELAGEYRVVYAAPDWGRMTVEKIAGLPVAAHVLRQAVLFLWVPPRLLLARPGAIDVLEAWGFTYQTNAVWDRVIEGSGGKFLSVSHEHLVIATRGDIQADVTDFRPRSVYLERRTLGESHVKPSEVRTWITKLFARGPFLELFGSKRTEGWSSFGHDPSQWAAQARTGT